MNKNTCLYLDENVCNLNLGCYWFEKNKECKKKTTDCGKLAEDNSFYQHFDELVGKSISDFKKILLDSFMSKTNKTLNQKIQYLFQSTPFLSVAKKNIKSLSTDKNYYFSIYNLMISNNYVQIISQINFEEKEIQKFLSFISSLLLSNKSDANLSKEFMYTLHHFIINSLNDNKTVESEENVIVSEELNKIGLGSFEKIKKHFIDIEPVQRVSSSPSIIFRGHLLDSIRDNFIERNLMKQNPWYYFKIFNYDDSSNKKSKVMWTELSMYHELFKLVQYNITPNVITKIIAGFLPNFNKEIPPMLTPDQKTIYQQELQKTNNYYGLDKSQSWNNVGLILTNPGQETFHTIFYKLTSEEKCSVLFQLFYTLYVFEKLQVSHGDIHTGNIFINTIEPTYYIFIVQGKYYRIRITKLVKIYDFDNGMIAATTNIKTFGKEKITIASIPNVSRNLNSSRDQIMAQCSIYNPKLDIVIFCWALHYNNYNNNFSSDTETISFINTIFGGLMNGKEKIMDTFTQALKNKKNLQEFNQLYNLPRDKSFIANFKDTNTYGISSTIYSMTWNKYYKFITDYGMYGRIIKNEKPVSRNHLWIPDEILPNSLQILGNPYFKKLEMDPTYKIKPSDKIFTLDNRI